MQVRPGPARTATAAEHSRTTAEELASATGATISRTEDGFAAVTFAAPGTPAALSAPAGTTVSRSVNIDELDVQPAERSAPAQPQQPAPPAGEGQPGAAGGASSTDDKDEIYDYVVDRLKRDLFAEQEQAGIGPTLL
jgi:hypothetical protein